jgi:hypothetical protein
MIAIKGIRVADEFKIGYSIMKYTIYTLSVFQCAFAIAKPDCIFKNNNVEIFMKWNRIPNSDSEILTVKLHAIRDILVPDSKGCFNLDTIYDMAGNFRSYNCPIYLLDDGNSNYTYLKKDSIVSFDFRVLWKKEIKNISLDIVFIPTNTCEYQKKKNGVSRIFTREGKEVFSITQEDEIQLVDRVNLEVNNLCRGQ